MTDVPAFLKSEIKETKRMAPKTSGLKGIKPTSASPSKPKILIFGKAGVGKTFTSLDFPVPYMIDTESGADLAHYTAKLEAAGGSYFGTDQGSLDFKEVIEQVKILATFDHPYKTLIIDSVSKIFNTTIAVESERLGASDQYGASKKPAVSLSRQLINWLDRLDMTCILIAHQKPEWGIDKNGQRAEIGQTYDAYDKLDYEFNLCLNITKEGDSRKARVRKSRFPAFTDGMAFEWSYARFAELYGKDIIEKKSEVLKLATPEQIKEFNDLLEIVKTPDDWLEKNLTKFKAAKLEELDESKLAGLITILKGKVSK